MKLGEWQPSFIHPSLSLIRLNYVSSGILLKWKGEVINDTEGSGSHDVAYSLRFQCILHSYSRTLYIYHSQNFKVQPSDTACKIICPVWLHNSSHPACSFSFVRCSCFLLYDLAAMLNKGSSIRVIRIRGAGRQLLLQYFAYLCIIWCWMTDFVPADPKHF